MRLLLIILGLVYAVSAEAPPLSSIRLALSFGQTTLAQEKIAERKGKKNPEYKKELLLLEVETLLRAGRSAAAPLAELEAYHDGATKAAVQYWTAFSLLQAGDYSNAREQLLSLLETGSSPYAAPARRNLCQLYLHLKNPKQALDTISAVENPRHLDTILLKTEAYIKLNQLRKAEATLSLIPAGKKSLARDYYQALILYQTGKPEEAKNLLEGNTLLAHKSPRGRAAKSLLVALYLEQEDAQAIPLIHELLEQLDQQESYAPYFDQLLLSVALPQITAQETSAFLEKLNTQDNPRLAPYILYTQAQLHPDSREQLAKLLAICQRHPSHELASKSAYHAAKLALELPTRAETHTAFQTLLSSVRDSSLKAKLYAMHASLQTPEEKIKSYRKALLIAPPAQQPALKANYELANYEFGNIPNQSYYVSGEPLAELLLEKGLASRFTEPAQALIWLEEYLTHTRKDDRKGEAHLAIAQLHLASSDPAQRLSAGSHLAEIHSKHQHALLDKSAYYAAQIQLAIIKKEEDKIEKLVQSSVMDPATLIEVGYNLFSAHYAIHAQPLFRKALEDSQEKALRDLANYYLALSYFQMPTASYHQDAIKRLELLAGDSSCTLHTEAQSLLASRYVDTANRKKALHLLDSLPPTPQHQLLRAQALSLAPDTESINQALTLYKALIHDPTQPSHLRYQVALHTILLQREHDQTEPAFELCYKVATFENLPHPRTSEEWELFRRIGNVGLQLLEGIAKPESLRDFALSLAAPDSPHKEAFQQKADDIALKYFLWDEDNF